MNDPYQILGVSRDASDEEIKKAYRALSRKYHPDANINNPLKDEAEKKFKEVQQAYRQIMDEREHGGSGYGNTYGNPYGNAGSSGSAGYGGYGGFGGFYGQGSQTSGSTESDIHLQAAANYIRSAHYREALNVLDGIKDRSALWYFYSASANSGIGNNVTALEHAEEAVRLEPDNFQYQMLLQRLKGGGGWYQQQQGMYGYPMFGNNSYCMKLCVANLICNLCCGSGICCGGTPGGGYYM